MSSNGPGQMPLAKAYLISFLLEALLHGQSNVNHQHYSQTLSQASMSFSFSPPCTSSRKSFTSPCQQYRPKFSHSLKREKTRNTFILVLTVVALYVLSATHFGLNICMAFTLVLPQGETSPSLDKDYRLTYKQITVGTINASLFFSETRKRS
jgi:hypothetical protein